MRPVRPAPTPVVSSPVETNPAAAESKRVLDAFMKQVGVDLLAYEKKNPTMSASNYGDAEFKASFSKSLAYVDPQLTDSIRGNLIRSISKVYWYDRSARIEANENGFIFPSAGIASILLSDFTYSMGSGTMLSHPDKSEAYSRVSMSLIGGKWVITGFSYS